MIDIGYRTGLFEASSQGPATSEELSDRAGLHERYVREWLGAMTTSGIYQYDADTEQYTLPAEHALLLTGGTARNLGPISRIIDQLGEQVPTLVNRFRDVTVFPTMHIVRISLTRWMILGEEYMMSNWLMVFLDASMI